MKFNAFVTQPGGRVWTFVYYHYCPGRERGGAMGEGGGGRADRGLGRCVWGGGGVGGVRGLRRGREGRLVFGLRKDRAA